MCSRPPYRLTLLAGIAVFCVFILLSSNPACSQTRIHHSSFVIDHWGMEDGLPVNNVLRIQQTQDGYLWFVTFDGLVRFDGLQFKVYQTDSYPNLPTNRLTSFHEAKDGSLWIQTEQNFLVQFKDGEFRHIGPVDGLNGTLCHSISKGPEGNIWLGTGQGINVYDGTELKPFDPEIIQGNIRRVFVPKNGAVWYADLAAESIYRYQNGETQQIFTPSGDDEFYPLYESDDGAVWLASGDDIYVYKDGSLNRCCSLGSNQSWESGIPVPEHTTEFGTIRVPYIGFDNGFHHYGGPVAIHNKPGEGDFYSFGKSFFADKKGGRWTFTNFRVSYNGELVLDIEDQISGYLFDREGNLWVGTQREGLYRIKPNPFTPFSRDEGLPVNNVYPLLEDREGAIWAGLFGPGVVRIKNGVVEKGPEFESEDGILTQSLLQRKDGTLLAGVIGNGYFKLEPGSDLFKKADEPAGIGNATVYAMHQRPAGDLWLGTGNGLYRKRNDEWQKFDAGNGFTNFPARYFLEVPDSSLWIATNGAGIARYAEGTFELYGIEDGLGSNLVRSLFIEPESNTDDYVLWAGTENIGLLRLEVKEGKPDFSTLTRYGRGDGMLDYVIHVILMDDEENFWFNTNRGIFTVPKEQLEAFHRGERESIRGISYTESDGLRNREGNGGMQHAGIMASDGRIWLPGQGGITVFDPSDITDNEFIPPVHIEELRTPDQAIVRTGKTEIELPADQRDFELEFTSLSFIEPGKNQFRYRLKGYSDDWIDAGSRRSISYTNIPAGRYTFEVMGSNNTGTWNPEPASRTIIIDPYFYETAWFRGLFLLFIGLVIYTGFRLRVRALKRSENRLKQMVEERTKQLKELNLAKTRFFTNMSHEFRTPLTLIISPLKRMLSNGADRFDQPAQKELNRMLLNSNRLMRLMDQTLEFTNLEQGKLKLRVREIELNNFLAEITELFVSICEEKNLELTCHAGSEPLPVFADPDKLDKMIGNLLSNAIKFTPTGGCISVDTNEEDEEILVTVSDTGIGISEEEQKYIFERFYQADSSETRYHEGSGIGLSLALDFAKLHKGDLTVRSAPGEGTTFTLHLKKGSDHFTADQFEKDDRDYVVSPVLADVGKTDEPVKNGEPDANTDQTTLLVVEDNADVRTFLMEELSGTYQVLEAANGAEALGVVEKKLPDLIIADIMMPEVDGITFNNRLKADSLTASIPVIFLTAKAAKENRLEGLEVGADAYITKPFDPDILKARVQNLIESRHRLRKLLQNKNSKNPADDPSQKSFDDPFLQKLDHILAENYSDPDFKVQDLADQLYLDRSHVLRKIKLRTELTTNDYIKRYRLEQALGLLQDQAGNITEIAYAVGFKSLSYFSYAFKEYYEISPSEYTNRYQPQ